ALNSFSRREQAEWPSSHVVRPALGVSARIFMSPASPFLKRIMVGMERTPYFTVVDGFSSTLSLTIFTLPESSWESSSRTGAIARQGPHHSAQKSTRTGSWELRTSSPKVASETCFVIYCAFWVESGGLFAPKAGESPAFEQDRSLEGEIHPRLFEKFGR